MSALRKALVIGASGFLGGRLMARLGSRGVATYHSKTFPGGIRFDARSQRLTEIAADLPSDRPHVIAPFGAIDMEGCARDPAGAARTNAVGVVAALHDAHRLGLKTTFISTDYVFGGERGAWAETDRAEPRMAYGAPKLAVEQWLSTTGAPWTVVRLSKVVSGDTATHSTLGQWVNDLRRGEPIKSAVDQAFSPAFVDDLADAVVQLAERGATGLFQAAGPECFSRIALLQTLASAVRSIRPDIATEILPCRLHDFPFLERRPLDTSLSVEKLKEGIDYDLVDMASLCARIAAQAFGTSALGLGALGWRA